VRPGKSEHHCALIGLLPACFFGDNRAESLRGGSALSRSPSVLSNQEPSIVMTPDWHAFFVNMVELGASNLPVSILEKVLRPVLV
jgi:hypothetical protein